VLVAQRRPRLRGVVRDLRRVEAEPAISGHACLRLPPPPGRRS
jgi:hypothetical protein